MLREVYPCRKCEYCASRTPVFDPACIWCGKGSGRAPTMEEQFKAGTAHDPAPRPRGT